MKIMENSMERCFFNCDADDRYGMFKAAEENAVTDKNPQEVYEDEADMVDTDNPSGDAGKITSVKPGKAATVQPPAVAVTTTASGTASPAPAASAPEGGHMDYTLGNIFTSAGSSGGYLWGGAGMIALPLLYSLFNKKKSDAGTMLILAALGFGTGMLGSGIFNIYRHNNPVE